MALKVSTYLTRKSALSKRFARIVPSEAGSGRCFSACRMALWAADFRAALMPANIWSKVARYPTCSPPMSLATSWTTPSIERSPTELFFPSNML